MASYADFFKQLQGVKGARGRLLEQFGPEQSLQGFQAAPNVPFQGVSAEEAMRLGETSGQQIYELQRRRLAQQGQGQQRALAQMFAGRGGGASSASASAIDQQLRAERDALADASLQAQLSGRQIGIAEAQRLGGQQEFAAQLQQGTNLANLAGRTGLLQQGLSGRQALLMQLQNQAFARQQQQQQNSGLGALFRGIGSIGAQFLPFGGGGGLNFRNPFGSPGGGGSNIDYSGFASG